MLRLKQYTSHEPTLEQRIDQLDLLIAAMESNALLADQQQSGLLDVGLESSFLSTENFAEKTKNFLQELWKKIQAFFSAIWEKLFGNEAVMKRTNDNAEAALKAADEQLKIESEIPAEQSEKVEEFKKAYEEQGKDAPIPEGLSAGLYQRLAQAHEMMFNKGVCAFANTHLRDQAYTNKLLSATSKLMKAAMDYIRKQSKGKMVPTESKASFEEYIKSNSDTKILMDLCKPTGVEFDGITASKLVDVRNAIAAFEIDKRIPLDIDKNKAFTHSNPQIQKALASLKESVSKTNKEISASEQTVKRIRREMSEIEVSADVRDAVTYLSDMGKAFVNFARLRNAYSQNNSNYLTVVKQVNAHYARKKGK